MFDSLMRAFFLVGRPLTRWCTGLYKRIFRGTAERVAQNQEIRTARAQALAEADPAETGYRGGGAIG